MYLNYLFAIPVQRNHLFVTLAYPFHLFAS